MKHLFTILLFTALFLLSSTEIIAQQNPETFKLELEDFTIAGLPGLHSFAWGLSQRGWIIIGGRNNGMHGFQPTQAFPPANANTTVYLVDPQTQQVWSASMLPLPASLAEQLASNNMQFSQFGNRLYITGGYGYKTSNATFMTFPNVGAVDLNGLADAIFNGTSITSYFRQINDTRFAVTGGYMSMIDSTFYLVGGHKFDGRYNPNNMPSFTQEYTNEIRKFGISDDGVNFSINNYSAINDTAELHRRDYNLVNQIFPNRELGFTAFSGVFRYDADLPWLNTVDITSSGYAVNNSFNQVLNQYHTAHTVIYDSLANSMHTVFFGGIGMYRIDTANNVLIVDSLVPFTKGISQVTRYANGTMDEFQLPVAMPGYYGASAEFFPIDTAPNYTADIFDLNKFGTTKTLIGHIYGGILSTDPDIFMTGVGSSTASNKIFRVYLTKDQTTGIKDPHSQKEKMLLNCFPNPANSILNIEFKAETGKRILLQVLDEKGREIKSFDVLANGEKQKLEYNVRGLSNGLYHVRIISGNDTNSTKVLIRKK